MNCIAFPVIDPVATGENIQRLRRERGLSVRDLQAFFGFEEPQAIYKWQRGKSLPSVDNLYALSALLGVSMDDIIVSRTIQLNRYHDEQQAAACCSAFLSVEQQKAADRITDLRLSAVFQGLYGPMKEINPYSDVQSIILHVPVRKRCIRSV